MGVLELATTAVVIAVVAIMAEASTIVARVASTTVASNIAVGTTATVFIVEATATVIGAAVFGSAQAPSATAQAVIARGSTTTTTAVGCMNANKHSSLIAMRGAFVR